MLAMRRISVVAMLVVFVVGVVAAGGGAHGASSSVTVSMDVPSATALTDQCTSDAGRNFGTVQPGTSALTTTGAGICRFTFSSSNDTSMIRLSQRDQLGGAMVQTQGAFVAQRAWGNTYYWGVSAYDANTAMAVRWGSIRQTTDGGATWSEVCVTCPAEAMNGGIARNNPAVRYIVGYAPDYMYKSTDSGVNWSVQAVPTAVTLHDVDAVTDQIAYAVGSGGTILRTLNGGTSWTTIAACPLMAARTFTRVQAVSTSVVWASGDNGVCRSTNANGGAPSFADASWAQNPAYISAVDANVAWLAVGGDGVYRTTDGGLNWTHHATQHGERFSQIAAISASSAIVTGWGGVASRTTDTGATWTRMPGISSNQIWDIAMADATTFFAVGSGATIARSTNAATWDVQYDQSTSVRAFLDVEAASGNVAWTVGGEGFIRGTTDGGTTWPSQVSGTTETLRRIDSVSTNRAWAVGDLGTIIATTNGGTTWSPQSSGTTLTLLGVSAADSSQVWASGEDGLLLRTSTGGTSWTTVASGTADDIKDVEVVAPGTIVYVTSTGLIRRSTNSGSTWTTVHTVATHWGAVEFASEQVGYAIGANDWIATTNDGGVTWTNGNTGADTEQLDVAAISTTHAAFAGNLGNVVMTSDRGATSQSYGSGVYWSTLYGVASVDAGSVWMVGEGGVIIKRNPPVAVSDYAGGANWASAATTNMFGVCLQAVGGSAAAAWTVDAVGISGQCEANDADPWRALPTAPSKVAGVAVAGASGSIDLVWGVRTAIDQPKGVYAATVIAEVIAPNA